MLTDTLTTFGKCKHNIYNSMIRFVGVAIGTALAGVLLHSALQRGLPVIEAYQQVYLIIGLAGLVGITTSLGLRSRKQAEGNT